MSATYMREALKVTEEGLRVIQQQLRLVTSDLSSTDDNATALPASLSSPTSLPALLPFPSPRVPALRHVQQLVEQSQQQIHNQVRALEPPPPPPLPPPIDPDIGLPSHSLSSCAPTLPLPYPLPSSSLSLSPPPQHQPAIHSLLEARHALYLATPERDASRAYLMERFGLRERGEGEGGRGRRPIEVYGRVVGGGRRRTTRIERPVRDRRPAGPSGAASVKAAAGEGEGLSCASVPPQLQHLGLFELVNRGYLRPNLDAGAIRNAARSSVAHRRASDGDRTARAQSRQWTVVDMLMNTHEKEEDKENGEGSAAGGSPQSISQSSAARSTQQQARAASRPSPPPSGLLSEEEQKQQEETSSSTSSASSASAPPSHGRARSKYVPSIGALHDSFSILPSSRSSSHGGLIPARSYDSLLDGFSQHPIFVQHGRILTDTPEFASFQRSHLTHWTQLSSLLKRVADFSRTVEGARVLTFYGSALAGLVERRVHEPTREELMQCMAPADLAALRARGEEAREREAVERAHAAATLITATLRMHIQRQRYQQLQMRDRAALLIQLQWRRWRRRQQTRKTAHAVWQEKLAAWKLLQQRWIASYGHFSQRQRVHVHLPSLSLSRQQRHGLYPRLSFHENQHLPRLCELSNPLISVLYLTAEPLPAEVESYYTRLLEVGGVKDLPTRLTFLAPERAPFFSSLHPFPLSTLALYSPRLLSSIRSHIHSRPAVIIPADPSLPDLLLAVELGLPLYAVDVERGVRLGGVGGGMRLMMGWNERCRMEKEEKERAAAAPGGGEGAAGFGGVAGGQARTRRPSSGGSLQSRQGAAGGEAGGKEGVVMSEEVYVPVMAVDVFDEEELLSRLSSLMVEHPTVDVWVMRVDDDREGWDVAWLHVPTVPGLREVLDAGGVEDGGKRGQRVHALLAEQLMARVVLLHPSFHSSLSAFFTAFYRIGGAVLPYPCLPSYDSPLLAPTVHMAIEPNGQLSMLSSLDQALVRPFHPLLSSFPSAHPSGPLHSLAAAIGKACWREGVIGPVSIDFLSLPSSLVHAPPPLSLLPPTLPPTVLVPVSIHLHCTSSSSQFSLFHFLMQGRYQWRSRPFATYRTLKPSVKEAREEEARAMKKEHKTKFHRASTSNVDQLLLRPNAQPQPQAQAVVGLATPMAPTPTLPTFAARLLTRNLQTSLQEAEEERFFTALPLLQLQPLSTLPLSSFFGMCRLKGVSFDVSERVGLCFMLYGRMAVGRLGVVGVGLGREDGVKRVEAVLRLMEEEWKGQDVVGDASDGWSSGEVAALRDIIRAVKVVGQAMQGRGVVTVSRFPSIKRVGTLDAVEEKQQQQALS